MKIRNLFPFSLFMAAHTTAVVMGKFTSVIAELDAIAETENARAQAATVASDALYEKTVAKAEAARDDAEALYLELLADADEIEEAGTTKCDLKDAEAAAAHREADKAVRAAQKLRALFA